MTAQSQPAMSDPLGSAMAEAATNLLKELLDEARNYRGPLSADARERLLQLVADPSPETWDAAHGIVLNGSLATTLWMAMLRVDPKCPERAAPDLSGNSRLLPAFRWNGYTPHPMLVLSAIRAIVEKREEEGTS